MADVELSYKGTTIGSLSSSGTLTMETAGKYCEADIELEYTQPSGQAPEIAACIHGGCGTTTYNIIGSPGLSLIICAVDPQYFSYADGIFTCQKAARFNIQWSARGAYSTSGNNRYCHFRLSKNGTAFETHTTNDIPNGGANGTSTVQLAVGDTFYVETKNNTGSTMNSICVILSPVGS